MYVKLLLGLAASALCCATLTAAHGQQPATLRADIASLAASDYPMARAVVNIEDASGAVGALNAANFTVTVGGKPAAIFSADLASSQNAPLDLLLLIDVSGSMVGDPMAQTKEAAKALIQTLAPSDRVALMSFADSVQLVQDYSTERARTAGLIDALVARGNTALYDATGAAASHAAASTSNRRAIILLSDGAQDGVKLKTTREEALAQAAGARIPFFAIGEGTGIDRAYLTELATSSTGRYLEAPKATDLGELFASLGQLLTSQFIVLFDASAAAGGVETPVTITVQSGGPGATAHATLTPGPGFAPTPINLTISGVKEGESVGEARVLTAVPDSAIGITRIAFYVDDVNVFETATAPYTFTFDPASFGAAPHTLKAAAIAGGTSFESPSISFASHPPIVAPASGGTSLLLPIGAGVGGLVALLGIAWLVAVVRRRLRRGEVVVASADQRITPWAARHRPLGDPAPDGADVPVAVAEDVGEALGVLISRGGPLIGSEFVVGVKPVGIGSSARCAVRIADPALQGEEARIWVRDGHLMLHRKARLTDVPADASAVGWTILQPGDHLDIGQHRFEFRLWTPPLPQVDDEPGEIPNILRGPGVPPRVPGVRVIPQASADLGGIWPRDAADPSGRDAQAS